MSFVVKQMGPPQAFCRCSSVRTCLAVVVLEVAAKAVKPPATTSPCRSCLKDYVARIDDLQAVTYSVQRRILLTLQAGPSGHVLKENIGWMRELSRTIPVASGLVTAC
eukprot:TRINITY_DN13514_c0_g2_i1.p1 TRINITY_DN13514_c0_g2~~TRINITY_DN13514_c0_g2_i1.p1  ORF type:complete len:108 (+),score=9.62 TRINITY_DN13514_c0_g2_i1:143-466(+)